MEILIVLLIGGGVLFAVVGGGWVVGRMLAWGGGWNALAEKYSRAHVPVGAKRRWCSGRVGSVGYNNALDLTPTAEGLDMAVMYPLGLMLGAHPPLCLPWESLRNPQPATIGFRQFVRYDVESPSIARVTLPLWVAEAQQENLS